MSEPCETCGMPVLSTTGIEDGTRRPVMLDRAEQIPMTWSEHTPQRCRDLRALVDYERSAS